MADVLLDHLVKRYGQTTAVSDLHIAIAQGEFFSLLGPSGCGKSTTLRMIAGFVQPTEGRIVVGGEDLTGLPPESRDIGIVFQNYAIFPHMHVFDNIAFGLRMRKQTQSEIGRKVGKALEQVGLAGYERRYQRELSGGEQQRVALARVLVTEPRILLLDEPLSALDKKLREEMKFWIKGLQQELGITTVYVTHDQSEALTMSDRIAVMSKGKVQQLAAPREIYEHPANRFVTGFIGESNILPARVAEANGKMLVLDLAGQRVVAPAREGATVGSAVSLVIRPEHVLLDKGEDSEGYNRLSARVTSESYQGPIIRAVLEAGGHPIVAEMQNRPDQPVPPVGAEMAIAWHPDSCQVLLD